VSCTGWGESIIKVVLAKSVIDIMEMNGGDPDNAVSEGLRILQQKAKGFGGLIAINHDGRIATAFNTPRLARAYMTSEMKTPFIEV
jgi:L-asparaginase / beta-aspartyl-peptidase